jgi:hypothetical protein
MVGLRAAKTASKMAARLGVSSVVPSEVALVYQKAAPRAASRVSPTAAQKAALKDYQRAAPMDAQRVAQ